MYNLLTQLGCVDNTKYSDNICSMQEHSRREIGGALTNEERERSQRILRVNFPNGIGVGKTTPDDARRRRKQLLEFFIRETGLGKQVASEQEVPVAVSSSALREPKIIYNASKKKGGLVFRAVIKAVHLYQSFGRRLVK